MAFNIKNRSVLALKDFSSEELRFLLKLAADLKAAKYAGTEQQHRDDSPQQPLYGNYAAAGS